MLKSVIVPNGLNEDIVNLSQQSDSLLEESGLLSRHEARCGTAELGYVLEYIYKVLREETKPTDWSAKVARCGIGYHW